jgi:hypothetical protein
MPGCSRPAAFVIVAPVALVDWAAVTPAGTAALAGTNMVRFAADGRITEVVGVA